MRLRGMAIAAVVALAACGGGGGGGGGGAKKGTVVVTGATNQEQAGTLATKTFAPKAGAVTVASGEHTDPTKLELTVFKTELYDGTAWTTIFESATGTPVDLVSNAGDVIGQGTVPAGTYGQIRFTVSNQVKFSANAVGTCGAAADQTFSISPDATRVLYFAIASQKGGLAWDASGREDAPYLMSAPIDVRDAVTTRVTLEFETSGTVTCGESGSLAIPQAPPVKTYSLVVPKTQPFQGAELWMAHYNMTGSDPALLADLNTAQGRADYRRWSGYNLGWGLKATFGAPTAKDGTVGILSLTGGMTENRRRVDETDCTDCGYQGPNGGDMYLLYTIDADRRVSFTMPNGPRVEGAFSEDFGTFIGATLDDRNSADLVFGVAVSPAQTLTGRYAWGYQGATLRYPTGSKVANSVYSSWAFGWANLDGTSSLAQYMAEFEFTNPTLIYGSGQFFWHTKAKPIAGPYMPASVSLDATGVGSLVVQGSPQWTVATPDGRVMLSLGDTTAAGVVDGGDTRYDQNLALMLKQAAPGTHSVRSLAGRWTITARVNHVADFAGDAVVFRGVQYGTITVEPNGAASFEAVIVDDAGKVQPVSGAGTLRVDQACIGRAGGAGEGGEKLPWNDATCAADGGEVLDVAVISAPDDLGVVSDVVWFVFDESASVAAFVTPQDYDPATTRGPTSMGYMVRASR